MQREAHRRCPLFHPSWGFGWGLPGLLAWSRSPMLHGWFVPILQPTTTVWCRTMSVGLDHACLTAQHGRFLPSLPTLPRMTPPTLEILGLIPWPGYQLYGEKGLNLGRWESGMTIEEAQEV